MVVAARKLAYAGTLFWAFGSLLVVRSAARAGRQGTPEPRMPDPQEAELIERAKKGDRAAFGHIVRAHQRRIFACAVQMLGDAAEADDVTQETFLRAFRAIAKFDGRSELSTWLYRICINVSLNAIRRRKRNDAQDIADPRIPEQRADGSGAVDPRDAAEASQLYAALAKAVDALSPSLRAALVLVCVQGLAHKDAAEVLGCPEGTIAWRIHEARARLRVALSDRFGDGAAAEAASRVAPAATATDDGDNGASSDAPSGGNAAAEGDDADDGAARAEQAAADARRSS